MLGFKVGLGADIGYLLSQALVGFSKLLAGDINYSDCIWAIHPGGRAIIDLIEKKFQLENDQTESTWKIYKNNGYMSSATIIFILEDIAKLKKEGKVSRKEVLSLAFGPGLSIEGVSLVLC